ncbi:hypothetical protein ACPPVO_27905 [Dactylosporangium sp. McL0621]|uniref:hypothetical protein n=1 Tax=Dactylosporangium sp. McL0621 TaxID=3415678 RepID=UPI003CF626FE
MERRNPYLVLGIMFGATPDEAREALARRLKAVRADDDSARPGRTASARPCARSRRARSRRPPA